MLLSSRQSDLIVNKFCQNKIDTSQCDFVHNCALALITTKRFDNAKDFLIDSIS